MSESTFTGPGEVLLAPETWGDIVPIRLDGQTGWSVGKDAFLACTTGVVRSTKSQGFGKALCTSSKSARMGSVTLTFHIAQSPARVFSCTTSAVLVSCGCRV